MANFETVTVETDVLILGGGMASCGTAVEAAYWAKQNGMKVTLVDKAAMDRSGAVAMGLSAINQYVGVSRGKNTLEQYVEYVRKDLMGVTREDLVYDIARHVDSSVHLFQKWGLPIWTDAEGDYVNEGRWQLMINGESYKIIVAEAAKNAMAELGDDGEIYERVFITNPIIEDGECKGAVGFSSGRTLLAAQRCAWEIVMSRKSSHASASSSLFFFLKALGSSLYSSAIFWSASSVRMYRGPLPSKMSSMPSQLRRFAGIGLTEPYVPHLASSSRRSTM